MEGTGDHTRRGHHLTPNSAEFGLSDSDDASLVSHHSISDDDLGEMVQAAMAAGDARERQGLTTSTALPRPFSGAPARRVMKWPLVVVFIAVTALTLTYVTGYSSGEQGAGGSEQGPEGAGTVINRWS